MISKLFAEARRFALKAFIVVGALTLCAGLATAATTISGTGVSSDGPLVIDGANSISIGTSTATAITIGKSGLTLSSPGTIAIGNADADFTPKLQGWTYAINNINRIQGNDGHANLGVTIQSGYSAEAIWTISYVTGDGQEADGATTDANITGNNSTAIASQPRAFSRGGSGNALYGVQTNIGVSNSSSVTTAAGAIILSSDVWSGGSILNNYGLLINDQTAGTNNWAIKTGLGQILFGDSVGIGVVTPTVSLQVATSTNNATTTVVIGKTGQSKGSCLELFDSAGTPVYAYVAAGASTFTSPCRGPVASDNAQ